MACETGTFFCLVRDHASAMIRFPSPPVRGRMPSHGRDARPCSSIGFGALVYATRGCGFESCQGRFGAVAQWQGVPSATGRSRVRTPPAPRHAACRRVQARTFRGTTSCQDGAPPEWNTRDGGAGRPVPRDADVVQWQHACFPSRRSRVRTPSSALSGKPGQWIRSTNGTRSRPFHVDASGENMDEQPRHGHAASRNRETCHRPGSSEEEQVPFKHWVRIS